MISFKEFLEEKEKKINNLKMLFEAKLYKEIPNSKSSYREDPNNTNTKTIKHAHVYAKRDGEGK